MYIRPYTAEMKPTWDEFVKNSRNGTFLFHRDYMDYHADRFIDCSIMAFDDKGKLLALLPASRHGEVVKSHGGLTYGGWIMGYRRPDAIDMMTIWPLMMEYYKNLGIKQLIYNPVPHIYHRYPAEEDLYALWRHGGRIHSQLMSTVTYMRRPLSLGISNTKAVLDGITIEKSNDYPSFWKILIDRLESKYSAEPVHSLFEIKMLAERFPQNIELYLSKYGNNVCGGILIYKCFPVIKIQYTASTEAGRRHRAIPFIISTIFDMYSSKYEFLDFGTSNEDKGQILNESLIRFKSGLGGRGIVYSTYIIDL